MPKRSLDATEAASAMARPDKSAQRKTERSHEENQERAYIAASRRADRSIEARVKSAQMASDIHKKRTGKGFKISERIVQAEEMYEEEEDDMPRSYRMLASHLQTSSPEMNYRVNAFLANRVAMASLVAGLRNEDWMQNPINKMFAEQFPNADKQAQAMSSQVTDSAYYGPVAGQSSQQEQERDLHSSAGSATSPMSPTFGHIDYSQPRHFSGDDRSHLTMSPTDDRRSSHAISPTMSPGAMDPMAQRVAPNFPQQQQGIPTDPLLYPETSSFTAELPPEAKMMAGPGLDMNDPMASFFMGGEPLPPYYQDNTVSTPLKHEHTAEYFTSAAPPLSSGYASYDRGDDGTPNASGQTENWDNFFNWGDCETTNETTRS